MNAPQPPISCSFVHRWVRHDVCPALGAQCCQYTHTWSPWCQGSGTKSSDWKSSCSCRQHVREATIDFDEYAAGVAQGAFRMGAVSYDTVDNDTGSCEFIGEVFIDSIESGIGGSATTGENSIDSSELTHESCCYEPYTNSIPDNATSWCVKLKASNKPISVKVDSGANTFIFFFDTYSSFCRDKPYLSMTIAVSSSPRRCLSSKGTVLCAINSLCLCWTVLQTTY